MITQHITNAGAFDAEVTHAMSLAFEQVCDSLRIDGDARTRETVAVRIIELARSGIVDAPTLRDRVLREAGFKLWD